MNIRYDMKTKCNPNPDPKLYKYNLGSGITRTIKRLYSYYIINLI